MIENREFGSEGRNPSGFRDEDETSRDILKTSNEI